MGKSFARVKGAARGAAGCDDRGMPARGWIPDALRLRRSRPRPVPRARLEDVRAVIVDDDAGDPREHRERAYATLAAIMDEAVILQDLTEALLVDIRAREPLAELAPRGGRLARRFVVLRERLPETGEPGVERYAELLRTVFDHHTLMISSSLDLLAVDWRSERMAEQLDQIQGLGRPAEWLDAARLELMAERSAARQRVAGAVGASVPGR